MKKQIKKSISLMLTVLMLMSCWVWVAPEKAEAATAGKYYVEVVWSASRTGANDPPDFNPDDDGGSQMGIKFDYLNDNGTGSGGSKVIDLKKKTAGTNNYEKIELDGFPTKLYVQFDWGSAVQSPEMEIKTIKIGAASGSEEKEIFNGVIHMESSTKSKVFTIDYNGNISSNDYDNAYLKTASTAKWELPKPTSIAGLGGTTNVTIPEVGSTSVVSNNFTGVVKDQYGVNWYKAPEYRLSASEDATTGDESDEKAGFWWTTYNTDGATVNVSSQAQDSLRVSQGNTKDYYLVANLSENNGTAVDSQKIHLIYPEYDWNFYGNGNGTVPTTPVTQIEMKKLDSEGNPVYETLEGDFLNQEYKAYGQNIKDYHPTDNVTKDGFTFHGFWTVQQPTDTNNKANPFAFESEFLMPVATETYDTMTDAQKDFYYPAGKKFDPKDSTCLETSGHTNYYAWWISDDINVRFYDINGKFLQEENLKYGMDQTDLTWPDPQDTYESGSYTYDTFAGRWENFDGEEVPETGYTFTHDLVLTPVYNTISFTDTYRVTVYNTFDAGSWYDYTKNYSYRATADMPSAAEVSPLPANAPDYSYTFEGWTTVAPDLENLDYTGNYHVMLEDGNFDVNGKAIYLAEDFTVRDNVSYYPVFRRHIKSHEVIFRFRDNTGEINEVAKFFNYGATITAPDNVPVEYATGGFGYTFESWTKDGVDVNLASQTCEPWLVYEARYSDGEPTPYNVSFIYRNAAGTEITRTFQVNHGEKILQETLDTINPASEYDNGEALVFYNGQWEYNGARYSFDALNTFSPENHVTFTAIYENPKPFHTVTYVDGSKTESFRVLDGSALPHWTNKIENEDGTVTEELYVPAKADTVEGRYTFAGWFDAMQADETYAETNGNRYGNQGASDAQGITTITSDVTLYPQFTFGLFEYHIEFRNWNGALLKKGTFHYLDSINQLVTDAQAAAVREADETYTYQFIGWDKKVPEFCEGGEPGSTLVFIAQYKPVYIYYDVEWFNDEAAMTDGTALTVSKYVYGDRMRTPSVALTIPDGKAFAGWYYNDNGVAKPFDRNLTVTGDMQFYATYVDAVKMWDVTVDDGKNAPYTFTVEDGASIKDIVSDPVAGYVDETKHNAFAGWTTDLVNGTAFDIETATITEDTTIYANYTESAHVRDMSEVTKYPSYPENGVEINGAIVGESDGKGEMLVWCECSKENTKQTQEIPALKDEKQPSASVYVGTQKWTSYDAAAADTTAVFAGDKTDLIVVTSDIGGHLACLGLDCEWCEHEALYNPTGKGTGLQAIYAYTAKAATTVDPSAVTDAEWGTEVFNWDTIKAELIGYYNGWENVPAAYKDYNANVTGKVGNLTVDGAPLTDAEQYVVYYKLVDKAGNISYMRTGAFIYDAKTPVISVAGDSNFTRTKYCTTATVTVADENGAELTVNDKKVALTDGSYTITEAGAYRLVATDAAGNRATASFEVLASHETRELITEPTCTVDGSKAQVCYNCNKSVGEAEAIPQLGHQLKTIHVDPSCTEPGYDETFCERCDLDPTRSVYADDGTALYPALGHNNVTTVTTEPTCCAEGTKAIVCSRCSETEYESIPVDTDAHKFYKPVVLRPTCTDAGAKTQRCRLCGITEVIAHGYTELTDEQIAAGYTDANYSDEYAMTGHIESSDERIIEEASCWKDGSMTKYCTVCNASIGEPIEISMTTVLHTWVLDEENCKKPTATEEGVLAYKCSVEGCTATATEAVDKIEQFTVTFLSEDGSTKLAEFTKTKGETIAKDAVEEPTKANSADNKYKYTFAGWYTKNADGEYETKYNLPMNVNADVALYAKFVESEIVYTIQFMVPRKYENGQFTDYELTKELMGAIGDERTPAAAPTFKADALNTYEFAGWKRAGAAVTDSFVITGDATYEATFNVVPKTVDVIFMNDSVALKKVTVNVGGTAVYDGDTPVKAADADNHYVFSGWNGDLTNITVKTTVYAQYNAIPHTWDAGTEIKAATCLEANVTEFRCTDAACGYVKTVTGEALGHDETGDIIYDAATGENYKLCERCGAEIFREKASYEIRFLNYNNVRLQVSTVEANGAVAYEGETPTKPTDAAHSYKFAGWKDGAGNEYLLDAEGNVALPAATADATYTAIYTETDITYVVTFIDKNGDVLQQTECGYGEAVSFTGDTTAIPVPDPDVNGHYAFSGWNKETTSITSDTVVRAVYSQAAHDYTVYPTGATCETAGGNKHECTVCEYSYVEGNIPATGHSWVVDYEVEPDFDNGIDGKIVYKCANGCGKTKEEVVNGQKTWVVVNVKDQNGNPFSGARVGLLAKEADGTFTEIDFYVTLTDGVAKFYVKPGNYKVAITASGMKSIEYEVVVNEDGTVSGGRDFDTIEKPEAEGHTCSCSCHKDNFWGTIFRFFQKIIKLFTGKPTCCADYDSRI